jgi:hypothetical protein
MTRLATRKQFASMRTPKCDAGANGYVVVNVTKAMAEREMKWHRKKNLNVRHAKENKPTHGSYGDQKEKDGEEEPLQQSGEAAK